MTNKELARKWFATIDAKDFAGLAGMAAPGHRFYNPMMPIPAGTEEHLGLIRMMTTALEGAHHLEQVLSEGDCAVVRGRWKGKHVGDFNGVPATGKTVEFSFIDVMDFAGGKLGEEHIEMNPMAIMAQIGAKL